MIEKNRSPFFPGQPIPLDYSESFVGRGEELKRVIRSVIEVEHGKQKMLFLAGEYGIGKSSFAKLVKTKAEKEHGLFGIHVLLNGTQTVDDISRRTLEEIIQSPTYQPSLSDKIRNIFSKYIDVSVGIPGVNVRLKSDSIKADAPSISSGYLPFLGQIFEKLKEDGIRGIFLIFDDLNGITKNPDFAYFIKNLVDSNALSNKPLPILLMLCGTNERRMEMISNYQPIDRIFEIVNLEPMQNQEMKDFFQVSFEKSGFQINQPSLDLLCKYSAGFPKVMHVVGDNVYWEDKDGIIDMHDATKGLLEAAKEIGRQSIDEQVLGAIKSDDYHNILSKLVKMNFDLSFKKGDVEKLLSENEKKKFHNFLSKMKDLNVIRPGDKRGEYIFNSRLTKLYILMNSIKESKK